MSAIERFIRFWLSVYFRIFFGKISFKAIDYMDAWGSPTLSEYEAFARGKSIGYYAHGSWNGRWYNSYQGQHLHKWCYELSWGW